MHINFALNDLKDYLCLTELKSQASVLIFSSEMDPYP